MQTPHHHHHHHLHQQLAALVSAALPPAADGGDSSGDERAAALDSLHHTILFPPNALLLSQSAPFLSQTLAHLLSDKSYVVRRAAAVAYGSLCAVVVSSNHAVTSGGLVDRFITLTLPQLRDINFGDRPAEPSIEGLREFLTVGDVAAIQPYVPPILKACQELLEDERASLALLRHLLPLLTFISSKFGHCFQSHFPDVVDLLLGWAFMPDLLDSDRRVIMNCFLQFKNHWLSNLNFSFGLLFKFLGDMEVLVQETAPQFGRLLALLSCFATILQVTASGMLEMDMLQQITEPVESMAPRLLRCISMFGAKLESSSKWMDEPLRCLLLLAEILREKFADFYTGAVDILFHFTRGVPSFQVHRVLKGNMQLLSMLGTGLLPSSVESILKFSSPLSQLRLHPDHLIVASVAASYLFFLQHGCDGVVSQAIASLVQELELLRAFVGDIHRHSIGLHGVEMDIRTDARVKQDLGHVGGFSEYELLSLIKFDLKILLCAVSFVPTGSSTDQNAIDTSRYERSTRLTSFILEKIEPFEFPAHGCLEFQVHAVRTLRKLSEVEFLSKLSISTASFERNSSDTYGEKQAQNVLITEYLRKYSACIVRALNVSSPLTIKLEALDWIHTFGSSVASMHKDMDLVSSSCEPLADAYINNDLLFSVLNTAYDRELKVRLRIASVLEVLLLARLIYPSNYHSVSIYALDKLGDPDASVKNSFAKVLSFILPITTYTCGFTEDGDGFCRLAPNSFGNMYYPKWKQVFSLEQLPRKLHSQHLVSILSYISQRWKAPLSSWIQRLVFSCRSKTGMHMLSTREVVGDLCSDGTWKEAKEEDAMLNKICSVNNLAAIWWLINEAARYCITLRLRTNLGGPTQTFAALERMLLDVPNVLQLDTKRTEGKYLGSINFHLLPMRLLLDFVEALKKNVYNAYEGSSVLPCPTRQSSLFFRSNRKVCEEWFSRICEPMMNAGLALHFDDATLHYCAIRLQELRSLVASAFKDETGGSLLHHKDRLVEDVLKVLRHASLALCRGHEPDALVGLQKWVAVAFPSLFMDDMQLSTGDTGRSRYFPWITGLVFQAQGQHEKAAAHFSHLLQSDEVLSSMGSDGIQFAIERVIESYTSLSDWKSLEIWLTELQALRALHAGRAYSGALTASGNEINAVHALARFDEGDIQAAWSYLDLTPKSSNELTLDPKVALERSEQMLLRLLLQKDERPEKLNQEVETAKLMLDEKLSVAPLDGLTEAAAYATQLHCIFAFEECTRFNGQEEAKPSSSILDSLHQVLHSPINRILQDCSTWIKICRVYRTLLPTSFVTQLLCQRLASLARKQRNFMLAHRMNEYIRDHPFTCSEGKHTDFLAVNMQYESVLLKYAEGKQEEALIDLWLFVRESMLSTTTSASANGALKAKACLKLSTWLRPRHSDIDLRNVFLKMCGDFHVHKAYIGSSITQGRLSFNEGNLISDANLTSYLDEIIGTARKVSCHLCPTMGKTWLSYASWCFGQARESLPLHGAVLQSCSLSPILHPEVSPDRFHLTEEEMAKVEAIITNICLNLSSRDLQMTSDVEHLYSTAHSNNGTLVDALVQQVAYLLQTAAEAPGLESSPGECPSVALSSQLQVLLCPIANTNKSDSLSSVNELIGIYWSLRRRRVSLFGHAAHGYFQYLSYSSSKLQEDHCASSQLDIVKEKARSCTLRAMLYVLHILLNYGVELRETLDCGFATVPLIPWQEITAQLFARLSSHPKQEVRKQLEGLLMMLAKLSPWSIVYPMLVDVNAYEGPPSEELQRIMDCLVKLYPKLIQDVHLVINELGMMTVLWEELWLSTLQDLHTDVVRRIHMLKEEVSRIAENSTLSHSEKNKINAAKYSAMMAPIIVALDRRLASTSREPKTAHEIWFHKEYGEQLKRAILAFKTPPDSATALGNVWQPFSVIAASLATHQRKSFISLSEVAPQLALLSSSDAPMPGLEKQILMLDSFGSSTSDVPGICTISSICEDVTILSTKTKPKKLLLLGSDGQKYTYLLKGREDLRLDARIMQLLQTVNGFLSSCADARRRSLGIRYYSVTPISAHAGLIQWVDNVTSIYNVYKSWQNRTQLAQLSAIGAGNTNNQVPPVPRPSDMFYGKIIPALKEKGIRRAISRKDWPLDVKRKVLLELMKETPRELLWQEMWCSSEGFKAFSSKAKRFSGTVAAMSMVGHILGLGDRHLDNILMDFSHGDVVHIDYNVCFDKGRRLKIPEIVPFRLTQTIETALGLTGTEGTFRANCEAIISLLRKNKDIVLMLLEVFVWDPLVEWTRGDSHDEAAIGGEEKKGMELAVSLSLFASRVQEIRVPLQEHHDLLIATMPAAESALRQFLDVLNQYEVTSAIFYHTDKERSRLLQHETSAQSIVAEATSILEKSRASFDFHAQAFGQAKVLAVEKAQEGAMWVDQHAAIIDALRIGSIPDAHAHIRMSTMEESLSLTSAVLVSGVPLTIVPEPTRAQCYDLDREVCHTITDLESGISCAIEVLSGYALALQRVLPLNYMTTSSVKGWAEILQLSVNNLSSDTLSLARRQAADLISKSEGDDHDLVQHRHRDLFQKMERYAIEIEKIDDDSSELMNSIGPDGEEKSKEHLLSVFTKYMQSAGYARNEDTNSRQHKQDGTKNITLQVDLDEKKAKVMSVLLLAVTEIYKVVKGKIVEISTNSTGRSSWRVEDDYSRPDPGIVFCKLEEQIEKCVLVAEFVNEVQEFVRDLSTRNRSANNVKSTSEGNWASVFQASFLSSKHLIEQMTEVALPEIIRSAVSYNSEVMDVFGSLAQIRAAIDTALEQLAEVELERENLAELNKNYFMKVGLITEQQVALEEASVKGRDHLSWEEAEELASQVEACKAQLDQLHQTWNQKDMRIYSLAKVESNIESSLSASERYFSSLTNIEQEADIHIRRSKSLLIALVKPFSELQLIDQILSSYGTISSFLNGSSNLSNLITSGTSLSESTWRFGNLLKNHSFFIWKVSLMDSVLDSCIHDISSSVDCNFGFDQLYNVLRNKLEVHMHAHIGQYLKERVCPVLLTQLEREIKNSQQIIEAGKEVIPDQVKRDIGAVGKIQVMLEEYCNAHETARAARSAVTLMKRQVNELTDSLRKTILEIVQIEWLHDLSSSYLIKSKVLSQIVLGDDKFYPLVLNLTRPKLLEKLQSSLLSTRRSMECLQALEKTSVSAEGQLERAMGWACAGTNTVGTSNSSGKSSGIPSEFHDHLLRRRQLLLAAREQAFDIIKICTSVMDFEASRDGLFWMAGERSSGRVTEDGKAWQQAFLNALTTLDVAYHSFTRAEQEWKMAQNNMEAASSDLFSVNSELCVASAKAKSASGELQDTLVALRDCAYKASISLSAFGRVSKGHTALTSECGSMLEEVLAMTRGLHGVYSLGKEAAAAHIALMTDLSKANTILLPLELSLVIDAAAMSDAMPKESKSNVDIPPVHGQALHQSYCCRLREACQSLVPLVPLLTHSVKELYSLLIKLARVSSLHAGNLHKAFEGLGESQVIRSQGLSLSRSNLSDDTVLFDKEMSFLGSNGNDIKDETPACDFSLQYEGWISPLEHSYTSSPDSSISSIEASQSEDFDMVEQLLHSTSTNDGKDSDTCLSFTITGLTEDPHVEKSESKIVRGEVNTISCATALPSDQLEDSEALPLSNEVVVADVPCSYNVDNGNSETTTLSSKNEQSSLKQDREHGESFDNQSCSDRVSRIIRGKNAYALSVVRQVELKVEGKDTEDSRPMKISDQVDHLIKQATNVNNLCNMYEGWTPWI